MGGLGALLGGLGVISGCSWGVSGWVSPRLLGSKDKDFVENLKKVYERQKVVRELIAKHEVAIGMSVEEVGASLGKPT